MGNSHNNSLEVNLDRTDSFYFSDETVSGTVDVNIAEEKAEASEISIQLIGKIGYATQTRHEPEYEHVQFYAPKVILAHPKPGQKRLVYGPGQYSWPFQIPLAPYLPPSINDLLSYPYVLYYLKVVIDRSWHERNKHENKYITVFPRVNVLQNPRYLEPTKFENHNRKDITLKGTLNKSGYVPGDLIQITLEIENPRSLLIHSIEISMLQVYIIGPTTSEYNAFSIKLPEIVNTKNSHIKQICSVRTPSERVPPSYEYQGGLVKMASVSNQYMLRFEVKVGGIFNDFVVEAPVTVGTKPDDNLNEKHASNNLDLSFYSTPKESTFNNQDAPPSFDSVQKNTK